MENSGDIQPTMRRKKTTIETNPKMIQMKGLVDRDIIAIVIILFHVLKKLEERHEQRISELEENLQNPFCHIM